MNIYKYTIFSIFNCPKFANSQCKYCNNIDTNTNTKTNIINNNNLCYPHKFLEFDFIK